VASKQTGFRRQTWLIVLLGATCIAAFFLSQDEPTPTKKRPVKSSRLTAVRDNFQPEDYIANFDRAKDQPQNSFQPGVLTSQVIESTGVDAPIIFKIPTSCTDGEGDWSYQGYAIVNGTKEALFESAGKTTSVSVAEGSDWKSCTLLGVMSDSVLLSDWNGNWVFVNRKLEDLPKAASEPQPGGQADIQQGMQQQMRGPIGFPRTIRMGAPRAVSFGE
jgi:hypothetical protein